MSDKRDHSTLKWIIGELEETIGQARRLLEDYAEDDGDDELMRECAARLHQVNGTLQMVEVVGGAMLAEEMESVALALADKRVRQTEPATELLMLSMIQLPGYLERLQAGHRDTPLALLPILNDLRAMRDEPLLSEAVLFHPDLEGAPVPEHLSGAPSPELSDLVRQRRPVFHKGLLAWYRQTDVAGGLALLMDVMGSVRDAAGTLVVHRLFDVATAVIEGLAEGSIEDGVAVRQLLGKIDRELKRLIDVGEASVEQDPPEGLLNNLLYYLVRCETENPRLVQLRAAYDLEHALPAGVGLGDDLDLSAPGQELMQAVGEAISVELTVVKDNLDLYIRSGATQLDGLLALEAPLHKLADTLGMVGQGELRSRLQRQVDWVRSLTESETPPEDEKLMEMAGDLLFVDTALANLSGKPVGDQGLPQSGYQVLLGTIMRESAVDLARIKDGIVEFMKVPTDPAPMAEVPHFFNNIAGAFRVLELAEAADLVDQVSGFVRHGILEGVVPEQEQLDNLADVITSIEYFAESLVEGHSNQDDILRVARDAMARLGYEHEPRAEEPAPEEPVDEPVEAAAAPAAEEPVDEPVEAAAPAAEEPVDEPVEAAAPAAEEPVDEPVEAAAAPAAEEPVDEPAEAAAAPAAEEPVDEPAEAAAAPAAEEPGGEPVAVAEPEEEEDLIDQEILEIFLEEAREELDVIKEYLPRWQKNSEDEEAMATFRRSFHTLKGSGRMVGAKAISEYAWSIENLLNRVIDGTVQANSQVNELLSASIDLLPGLIHSQAAAEPPKVDVRPLMLRAFKLAGAEPPDDIDFIPVPAVSEPEAAAPEPEAVETGEVVETEQEPPAAAAREEGEAEAEAPPAPGTFMDPELLEIFAAETRTHVATVRDVIASCRIAGDGRRIKKRFVRALHTLHGSAHLAEVESVAAIGAALERLANAMVDRGQLLEAPQADLLEQAMDRVESTVVALEEGGSDFPAVDTLIDRILAEDARLAAEAEAARAEQVEAVEETATEVEAEPIEEAPPEEELEETAYQQASADDELIEIFLEEARELLDTFETSLQAWIAAPKDPAPMAELQRTLHTLKGGARLTGLSAVGDLSHAFESLLTGISEGRVLLSADLVQVGQQVADRLTDQIDDLSETGRVRLADDLIAAVEQALSGEEAAAPAPEPEPEVEPEVEAMPTPEPKKIPPVPTPAQKKAPAPRAKQEQVRVRSDLLDRLVNNAGEVSIYRSRIEQQNGELGFNLNELEQTVVRLKDQLRQLDNETEAQILFRYEREGEQEEDLEAFDPLEMDRFSTMQQLSRSLVETVNDLVNIKSLMLDLTRETETLLLQQSRVATDLQDGLLRTRMVPFSQLVPRLRRIVRQTSSQLDKQVSLEVYGAEGEMDRSILERMIAPLEHILRNAVSHGIEAPADRQTLGKPEAGRVTISLYREGNDVVLEVADDGRGLMLDAIRARAVERGLLAEGVEVADDDLMQFILEPGFSTAEKVTQIAGRGVGMDVVIAQVKQTGGTLEIDSQKGSGTRFLIRLPFTLAITDALLVQLGDDVYAVPHGSIEGVVRVGREQLADCYQGDRPGFSYAGHDYQVRYLGTLLLGSRASLAEQKRWFPLMLVRAGEHRVALQVDELIGNRQIVVKSVGSQLGTVRWISGGTILADGRVALILDVNALVRMDATQAVRPEEVEAVEEPEEERMTVMVVDDSITVRKVTTRLLNRHGMDVMTAKDGVDAVAVLQDRVPDIMLLDIEMPRMDGYELARHIRNSEGLRDLPIIMITSRTGEKHRERAMELGVNRYLGKPFQESDLLDNIQSLLAESTK